MGVVQLTIILFGFWLVISGSIDPMGLAVGLVLSALIALGANRLLWAKEDAPVLSVGQAVRFVLYMGYLVKEIIWANIYVAEKVLDPRLPIDPIMVEHTSTLERPVSRTALANSITLTPGTLTVDVDGPVFTVHCLGREFADTIATRELEHKVARAFEEV